MSARGYQPPVMGLLGVSLALLLAACGPGRSTDNSEENVISGTVTAPANYDIQGTEVELCMEQNCREQQIRQAGNSAAFAFEDLEAGEYQLSAFKPLSPYEGFLRGCYGDDEVDGGLCTSDPISPPKTDADITLTHTWPPSPPPEPPLTP